MGIVASSPEDSRNTPAGFRPQAVNSHPSRTLPAAGAKLLGDKKVNAGLNKSLHSVHWVCLLMNGERTSLWMLKSLHSLKDKPDMRPTTWTACVAPHRTQSQAHRRQLISSCVVNLILWLLIERAGRRRRPSYQPSRQR